MFINKLVTGLNKGTDSCRRGIENTHPILLNDLPKARKIRKVRRAFIHDLGNAIEHRPVSDVGMSCDPAHISCAPVDIVIAHIKNILTRRVGISHIPPCRMENTLRLSSGARGIENKERVLAVEKLSLMSGGNLGRLIMPPDVSA